MRINAGRAVLLDHECDHDINRRGVRIIKGLRHSVYSYFLLDSHRVLSPANGFWGYIERMVWHWGYT